GVQTCALPIFAIFGVALIATIVLVLLVAGGMTRTHRVQPSPPAQLPPEPRLQVNAPVDLQHWRATEDALLNKYEWVDRGNGVVRIPISRAMALVEQRGLPK